MGYSSSKEYLRQYEKAVFRVQARTDQLVEMRVKSVSLSASSAGVRVQRSHSGDERARLIEKIVETERRLDEDIAREILVRDEITAAILEVPDPAEAQVLLYRYIHLLKWKEIASRLHYTLRWVYILHGKGLQKIKVP